METHTIFLILYLLILTFIMLRLEKEPSDALWFDSSYYLKFTICILAMIMGVLVYGGLYWW